MTADEVGKRGGIASSHISELKSGVKDPLQMRAATILRLAKGCNESPVTIFKAIIGKLEQGVQDEAMAQILNDFSRLSVKDREQLEFVIRHLKDEIAKRLDRHA